MGQGIVVDLSPLASQRVHEVRDFEGVPVQDGIGDETQAAGLIQNLGVIARRKLALIGKEHAPGQLVAVLPFVELELPAPAQLQLNTGENVHKFSRAVGLWQ